jgi:hypothetical protein
MMPEALRKAPFANRSDVGLREPGFRGKFVEIIVSPTGHHAAKSLKQMVGTTGIEPVTPTMSR